VTQAFWDAGRIRLRGLPSGADVRVRPGSGAELPAMAGSLVADGDDLCFVPRFPFVDGTTYTVRVGSAVVATLTRPRPERAATTAVVEIHPTAAEVPRNLLRCYVRFSAPMGMGYAMDHVRLADDAGATIDGALLPADHELWDPDRTRLTVLLDPGRIKRGLAGHDRAGYALRRGMSCRLVVDEGFRDAHGIALRGGAERRYRVGDDERRRLDPGAWTLAVPPAGSREPLVVEFDRVLDHGLLDRCLRVLGPVAGTPEIGPDQRSWRLTPHVAWIAGDYRLVVDPVLEDVAGNSVTRVFDRELGRTAHDPRTTVPFAVSGGG
jgi:hypothetical protein